MKVYNIKNVSIQPNVGPSVAMRIISADTNEELVGIQEGDVVSAKSIKTIIDTIESTPGKQGPKGDPGTPGAKGETGATGPMPTLVNNVTSTSTTSALTAAQGKVLNDLIIALTARVAALEAKP